MIYISTKKERKKIHEHDLLRTKIARKKDERGGDMNRNCTKESAQRDFFLILLALVFPKNSQYLLIKRFVYIRVYLYIYIYIYIYTRSVNKNKYIIICITTIAITK